MTVSIKFSSFIPEQTTESVYRALLVELFDEAELKGEFIFNYHHKLKGAADSRGIAGMVFKKKGKKTIEVALMPDRTNIKIIFLVNCPKPDDTISRLKGAQAKLRDRDEEAKRTSERKAAKEAVSDGSRSSRDDRKQVEAKADAKKMVVSASDIEIYRRIAQEARVEIGMIDAEATKLGDEIHDRVQHHKKLKRDMKDNSEEIVGLNEQLLGHEAQIEELKQTIADLEQKVHEAKQQLLVESEKKLTMGAEDAEHLTHLGTLRSRMSEVSRRKEQLEKECSEAEQEIALFESEHEQSAQVAIELMRAALENLSPERREHVLRQYSLQSVGL